MNIAGLHRRVLAEGLNSFRPNSVRYIYSAVEGGLGRGQNLDSGTEVAQRVLGRSHPEAEEFYGIRVNFYVFWDCYFGMAPTSMILSDL